MWKIFLGDEDEREGRIMLILFALTGILLIWMYLGSFIDKSAKNFQDTPLVIQNSWDLKQKLTDLEYRKTMNTQLDYGDKTGVLCREVRTSSPGLPVGLHFTDMGSFQGDPEQKGFFEFYYQCRYHDQIVSGSLPIRVH